MTSLDLIKTSPEVATDTFGDSIDYNSTKSMVCVEVAQKVEGDFVCVDEDLVKVELVCVEIDDFKVLIDSVCDSPSFNFRFDFFSSFFKSNVALFTSRDNFLFLIYKVFLLS